MASKDWVKTLKYLLKHVDKMDPKDRLGYVSCICGLNNIIMRSCAGWVEWLSHPQVMEDFTEAELKEIFVSFKKITKEFVKSDLEWTRKKWEQHRKGEKNRFDYVR